MLLYHGPTAPPSTDGIRKGYYIIGVFAEEMTVIAARTSTGSRVTKGLRKVILDKVPSGTKCVSRSVGNIKEAIRG